MSKSIRGRVNDPVFQHTSKPGIYTARLMGFDVRIEKLHNAYWEVHTINHAEGEDSFLASGATRNDAMKEAYYTIMYRESQRLNWILTNQPYRQYPDTHPRRKTSLKTPDQDEAVSEVKGTLPTNEYKVRDGKLMTMKGNRVVTHEKLNRIKDLYMIKHNRNLGGHFWFRKDSRGVIDQSSGPFETEDLAFKDILIKEHILQ